MFDSRRQFAIPVNSGVKKRCVVRFPTDDEWAARAVKQVAVRHTLGRGESELKVAPTGADLELLKKIRIPDEANATFDDAEASVILNRLERAEVLGVEENAEGFTVTLRVLGDKEVSATLRMPTAAQVLAYSRDAVRAVDARRLQRIYVKLPPGAELFDALKVRHEGYADSIPIVHKCTIVGEVIGKIEASDEEIEELPEVVSPAAPAN